MELKNNEAVHLLFLGIRYPNKVWNFIEYKTPENNVSDKLKDDNLLEKKGGESNVL